jgi:hypothetical protein
LGKEEEMSAAKKGRGWTVTIFDANDKNIGQKECKTLAEVAGLFGRTKACDLSHLLYRVSDDEKRRRQMLQRWGVHFNVERRHAALPAGLKMVIDAAKQEAATASMVEQQ